MHKELISKTSIEIKASASTIWEALTNPEIAKEYFFGATLITDWEIGNPIVLKGEFNGNKYEEKGVVLKVEPNALLQYSHWSHFDGLADEPENYRVWTFEIGQNDDTITLSISEDNIPTEKKRMRSNEFWNGVLQTIKNKVEN